jgi:hypothetical protein
VSLCANSGQLSITNFMNIARRFGAPAAGVIGDLEFDPFGYFVAAVSANYSSWI